MKAKGKGPKSKTQDKCRDEDEEVSRRWDPWEGSVVYGCVWLCMDCGVFEY